MVEDTLKQLGFGEKEITVYLSVLRRGKTTPARVANETGINRPTVYAVAKNLIEKGVLSEDLAGPNKYLVAGPVESLVQMVEVEKQSLAKRLALAKSASAELAGLAGKKQYSIPRIKFVESRQIEEYLYKQSPTWSADIVRNQSSFWGFQDHTFVEHYQEWIDWYWANTDERVSLKLLSNESDVESKIRGKHTRRNIRFWPHATFDATIWIMGDYIAMIYTREKPYYLVEIHDAVMSRNLAQLFAGIWEGLDSK